MTVIGLNCGPLCNLCGGACVNSPPSPICAAANPTQMDVTIPTLAMGTGACNDCATILDGATYTLDNTGSFDGVCGTSPFVEPEHLTCPGCTRKWSYADNLRCTTLTGAGSWTHGCFTINLAFQCDGNFPSRGIVVVTISLFPAAAPTSWTNGLSWSFFTNTSLGIDCDTAIWTPRHFNSGSSFLPLMCDPHALTSSDFCTVQKH